MYIPESLRSPSLLLALVDYHASLSNLLLGHDVLRGLDVLGDHQARGLLLSDRPTIEQSLLHLPLLLPEQLSLLNNCVLPLDV